MGSGDQGIRGSQRIEDGLGEGPSLEATSEAAAMRLGSTAGTSLAQEDPPWKLRGWVIIARFGR